MIATPSTLIIQVPSVASRRRSPGRARSASTDGAASICTSLRPTARPPTAPQRAASFAARLHNSAVSSSPNQMSISSHDSVLWRQRLHGTVPYTDRVHETLDRWRTVVKVDERGRGRCGLADGGRGYGPVTGGRFQILSLDGGGLRGMFSAAVLARLEEDLDLRVPDHFDLIAGTSTGGIIALGLGLGLTPREILQFYTDHGPRIFRDRSRLRGVRHLLPWARDAVEVLMRAQSESATKQVRHFLGADQVLRLNPTVPTGA